MTAPLFPFRYFDPLRKRWVQGRYKATLEQIEARYAQWEITGPAWTPPDIGGTASQLAGSRQSRS